MEAVESQWMIIKRYFFKTTFFCCLGILFAFWMLMLLGQFIEQSEFVGAHYTFYDLAQYGLVISLGQVYELLPIIFTLGVIVNVTILIHDNELTPLRAAGMSLWNIVLMSAYPMLFLNLIMWGIGEFNFAKWAQNLEAKRSIVQQTEIEPVWIERDGHYIYINTLFPDGRAYGIKQWKPNERHDFITQREKIPYMKYDDTSKQWEASQIKTKQYSLQRLEHYQQGRQFLDWELEPVLLNNIIQNTNKLPLHILYPIVRSEAGHSIVLKAKIAFWNRLLLPLSALSLIVLSLSFLFETSRQKDIGRQVFYGCGVGIIAYIIQSIMSSVTIVFNLQPFLVLIAPIVVTFILGFIAIKRL